MPSDDLFDDDPKLAEVLELYAYLRGELADLIDAFREKEGIDEGHLSDLLLDLAVIYRTIDYVALTEKPSKGGLRLEYDRMRKEFDDVIRLAKKEAALRIAAFANAADKIDGTAEEANKT